MLLRGTQACFQELPQEFQHRSHSRVALGRHRQIIHDHPHSAAVAIGFGDGPIPAQVLRLEGLQGGRGRRGRGHRGHRNAVRRHPMQRGPRRGRRGARVERQAARTHALRSARRQRTQGVHGGVTAELQFQGFLEDVGGTAATHTEIRLENHGQNLVETGTFMENLLGKWTKTRDQFGQGATVDPDRAT